MFYQKMNKPKDVFFSIKYILFKKKKWDKNVGIIVIIIINLYLLIDLSDLGLTGNS